MTYIIPQPHCVRGTRYADQNVREVWYQENSRRKRSTFGKTLLESSN